MALFSNLFKSKPKATFDTPLGLFTLVYSKGNRNTWNNKSGEILLSVRGSATQPDADQLKFVQEWQTELLKLDNRITKRFVTEFEEAGLSIDFTHWSNKFKIVAIEIMLIFEREIYWNITFEETKESFAHFTLFIEGEKLTDFSIDT
ncbi:MAG TPA: hypothetical protein VL946_08695 [Lacibacter sp.]|jgi:hypothetical protein|nr:hypothetical protein [Lacibacter sp.]